MAQSTQTPDTHRGRLHEDVLSSRDGFHHDVQTGQPLLQQCDSEHTNVSGTDDVKGDFILGTSAAQDLTRQPTSCRRATAPSTIGQAALDICITTASIYFVAFAFMAFPQNGKSAASTTARHLLDAARLVSFTLARCRQSSYY
jgi:hypothetical protein